MFADRANVVGRLRGSGGGNAVIFNAHMDVAWGPEERRWMHDPDNPIYTSAWREGDTLVGNGLINDKGPLACTLIAAKAVAAAGAPLAGDLIVTGVCGEIGQEPVDEFTSPGYLSKEVGARYLITHGVIGDYAVVAEATSFGVTWVEAGKAFFKVTVLGGSSRYTPYVTHPERLAEHGNALVRVVPVIEALTDWGRRYEVAHEYRFAGGRCVPKVNIGAIRGGQPFLSIVSAERCYPLPRCAAHAGTDGHGRPGRTAGGAGRPRRAHGTRMHAVPPRLRGGRRGAAPGRHRDRSPGRVRHGARRGGAAALEHVA